MGLRSRTTSAALAATTAVLTTVITTVLTTVLTTGVAVALVGASGTGSAASASPLPRVARVAAVAHAPRTGATGELGELVVVDHNIEKRPRALDRALVAARTTGAAVITLQEVCGWQADELSRSRPGWTVAYRADREHVRCARTARRTGSVAADAGTLGTVAIWTGGPDGSTSTHTFRHQRVAADRTGLICVSWTDRVVHRACSVHLIAPATGEQIVVRTRQAADLRELARRWVVRDELVVLAGDFNAEPHRRTMHHLYARGGRGDFREAGEPRPSGAGCRCDEPTLAARDVKIDYVFWSANRTAPDVRPQVRTVPTASDHDLLVGRARVDVSPG